MGNCSHLVAHRRKRENWPEVDFSGKCVSRYIRRRNMLTHPPVSYRQIRRRNEGKKPA
jgi:hypothetical protein